MRRLELFIPLFVIVLCIIAMIIAVMNRQRITDFINDKIDCKDTTETEFVGDTIPCSKPCITRIYNADYNLGSAQSLDNGFRGDYSPYTNNWDDDLKLIGR